MPRLARKKSEGALYHVMARSISEVDLFKNDEDKIRYMTLIKEYQLIYNFKVYAYCLMDTHLHLIIDPNGADISKIMHCINFKYARYFNTEHKRHGHLFQDRFKSKIVEDDRYLIALSAYIHNNPSDIGGYNRNLEEYYFSSLAVYLGLKKDPFDIVDEKFILSIMGSSKIKAREKYMNLVIKSSKELLDSKVKEDVEFENEKTEYRSERKILVRNFKVGDVENYVLNKFKIEKTVLYIKYKKEIISVKAILVLLLRNLCNISCKGICGILGNITSSGISKLSMLGASLISNDDRYKNIMNDFMAEYCG